MQKYTGNYSTVNGAYGGIDDLGRVLPLSGEKGISEIKKEKTVGIFYFLWQGQHGVGGPYDNYKIVSSNPEAILSEQNWYAAGGGERGEHHFWGEPLFGYYTSNDKWVMRKHIQMLTAADVDYMVFDTTNAATYVKQALDMLALLDEFYKAGEKEVPQIAFYTNTASGQTMTAIYENIYEAHPEYSDLWFRWDGKPMIIGTSAEADEKVRNFFRIKESQWPNDPQIKDDGFPWMEFERYLTKDSVYGTNGRKEVVSVSPAQHSDTVRFSATAWYGGDDRSRSWHSGENDTAEDAIMYGYNFADSWEFAIAQDPETIFVTGWNEWVAQRGTSPEQPIVFVDCADPNNSRDVEPMLGLFGDNYYMQMVYYIRKFKGVENRVDLGPNTSVDIKGSFDQMNQAKAVYTDYVNDTVNRYCKGFGNIHYSDDSGRNDFKEMRVVKDNEFITFYVETANEISTPTDRWMSLFIRTNNSGSLNWHGFDYVVNRICPAENLAILEKSQGDWNWKEAAKVSYKMENNKMMIQIPRTALEILSDALIDIEFKWADNYAEDSINSFYTEGDCAPYGRFTYVFSERW